MNINKFVITGAPSSGKTTIISILNKIGFTVVPEVARDIILDRMHEGKNIDECSIDFQLAILEGQIKREESINIQRSPIFFDRGIPDVLSYIKNLKGSQDLITRENLLNRYDKVFFLEGLQIEDDGIRETDPKKIQSLNEALQDSYETLGYDLIHVPNFSNYDKSSSTALRLQLIFNHVFSYN